MGQSVCVCARFTCTYKTYRNICNNTQKKQLLNFKSETETEIGGLHSGARVRVPNDDFVMCVLRLFFFVIFSTLADSVCGVLHSAKAYTLFQPKCSNRHTQKKHF